MILEEVEGPVPPFAALLALGGMPGTSLVEVHGPAGRIPGLAPRLGFGALRWLDGDANRARATEEELRPDSGAGSSGIVPGRTAGAELGLSERCFCIHDALVLWDPDGARAVIRAAGPPGEGRLEQLRRVLGGPARDDRSLPRTESPLRLRPARSEFLDLHARARRSGRPAPLPGFEVRTGESAGKVYARLRETPGLAVTACCIRPQEGIVAFSIGAEPSSRPPAFGALDDRGGALFAADGLLVLRKGEARFAARVDPGRVEDAESAWARFLGLARPPAAALGYGL